MPNERQDFFRSPNLAGIPENELLESLKESNKKFNQRKPYVGEIVLFTANPDDTVAHSNNNADEIPAIVTRVWSEVCVNVKIIPDCGAMQDRTSVVHFSANPAGYHFRFKEETK